MAAYAVDMRGVDQSCDLYVVGNGTCGWDSRLYSGHDGRIKEWLRSRKDCIAVDLDGACSDRVGGPLLRQGALLAQICGSSPSPFLGLQV